MAKMGRPRKVEHRVNQVMVRFTDNEYRLLKERAEQTNLTIAEIVRHGVDDIVLKEK